MESVGGRRCGRVVVLCERVAHVALELGDGEEQFKLVVGVGQVLLKQGVREASNEAPLIILHHVVEVVLEKL